MNEHVEPASVASGAQDVEVPSIAAPANSRPRCQSRFWPRFVWLAVVSDSADEEREAQLPERPSLRMVPPARAC